MEKIFYSEDPIEDTEDYYDNCNDDCDNCDNDDCQIWWEERSCEDDELEENESRK